MHFGNGEFCVHSEFSLSPIPSITDLAENFSVWHVDKTNSNTNAGFYLSLYPVEVLIYIGQNFHVGSIDEFKR